jgi:hypothetical protein
MRVQHADQDQVDEKALDSVLALRQVAVVEIRPDDGDVVSQVPRARRRPIARTGVSHFEGTRPGAHPGSAWPESAGLTATLRIVPDVGQAGDGWSPRAIARATTHPPAPPRARAEQLASTETATPHWESSVSARELLGHVVHCGRRICGPIPDDAQFSH